MEFNYQKLLGRIKEFGFTQETLAKKIGITEASMSLKLNNKSNFKQKEIRLICKVLKIHCSEIGVYFFTPIVRKRRTKEAHGVTMEGLEELAGDLYDE